MDQKHAGLEGRTRYYPISRMGVAIPATRPPRSRATVVAASKRFGRELSANPEFGRINVHIRDLHEALPRAADASASDLAIGKAPEANFSAVLLLQVGEPLFMRCD